MIFNFFQVYSLKFQSKNQILFALYIIIANTTPTDNDEEWTCKKCTLVNSQMSNVCIVCGGSKLRSITAVEDMTLRKGEFWSCSQCTLKNSLANNSCSACKAARQSSNHMSRPSNNLKQSSSQASLGSISGLSSSSRHNNVINNSSNVITSSSSGNNLMPPVNRISRSPSPRNERLSSGAIPKVIFFYHIINHPKFILFIYLFIVCLIASQHRCDACNSIIIIFINHINYIIAT